MDGGVVGSFLKKTGTKNLFVKKSRDTLARTYTIRFPNKNYKKFIWNYINLRNLRH